MRQGFTSLGRKSSTLKMKTLSLQKSLRVLYKERLLAGFAMVKEKSLLRSFEFEKAAHFKGFQQQLLGFKQAFEALQVENAELIRRNILHE